MASSRKSLILGSVVVLIIAAALLYRFLPRTGSNLESPTPEANMQFAGESVSGDIEFSADTEIEFSKSLLILSRAIAVDGGEIQKVPCTGKNGKPELLGYIKEKETRLELICINDFMGGISLQYQEASGKKIHLNLGRTEGDAGDLWETRSLVSKDDAGLLLIDSITLTSSQEILDAEKPEDIPPPTCDQQQIAFAWDPARATFIETLPSDRFTLDSFTPPIEVDDGCLDENGNWQIQ